MDHSVLRGRAVVTCSLAVIYFVIILDSSDAVKCCDVSETGPIKGGKGAYSVYLFRTGYWHRARCVLEVLGLNLCRGTCYLEFVL